MGEGIMKGSAAAKKLFKRSETPKNKPIGSPRFPRPVPIYTAPVNGKGQNLPAKRPPGTPPKYAVDWELVYRLAMIHCTADEIAAVLRVPLFAVKERKEFPAVYRAGWERGKMSLRRMQFLKAREGNSSMLIFLGKQILGQRDFWTGELSGPGGGPIPLSEGPRPALEKLSLEELQQLRDLVTKAAPPQIQEGEIIDVEALNTETVQAKQSAGS